MKSKRNIHVFFAIVFVITIALPSVLPLLVDAADISLYHDLGEDESDKEEKESQKNFEITFLEDDHENSVVVLDVDLNSKHYLQTFEELHLENISPPPEHI